MSALVVVALVVAALGLVILVATITYALATRNREEVVPVNDSRNGR